MSTQSTGYAAETLACQYLQERGLDFKTRNYRCFLGEIDLIMSDHDIIVFVEVRYRSNKQYGQGLETITSAKRSKLIRTALHYLQKKNWLNEKFCRFDVVSIEDEENILWIKNAFEVK